MEIWEMMCDNVNDFSVLGYADPADAGIWDTHKTPFVPRRLFGGAAILKSGCPILLCFGVQIFDYFTECVVTAELIGRYHRKQIKTLIRRND